MPALTLSPYSIPLAISAGISAWLAFLVWRRRPGPGVNPLVAILALILLWNVAYNFEIAVDAEAAKRLLAGIQYIAITLIPVSWLAFVLEYSGREKWLTQRNLMLLLIEPVIVVTIALTNRYHTLLYTSVTLLPEGSYSILLTQKGPVFWLHWIYAYIVLLTATILLLRSLWRSPQIYRGQLAAMLIGAFTPWIANLLYVTELNPVPLFDFTPVAFSISGLAFAYSMLRYRLMDIIPVAREMVIESMSDAMLLLDNKGRIVDANPAARLALSSKYDTLVSKDTIIGKPARAVLRSYENLADKYAEVDEASDVISLGETLSDQRYYDMRISPLHNRSGNLTGRVIVLHDVTDMKRANERIRAQNQTLIKTNEALERAQKAALEANRLKTEFLATMSHELRTPLNAIIGFSDLMMTGATGEINDKQEDYVNRILNNSERLLSLINDILDVAKIEAGRLEMVE
ncbi:MAG: PAS domain-containing protein, partial [Anaerolineae bacterium]|nr:PAS domain-containing protein [Anaerolineae bacterium]